MTKENYLLNEKAYSVYTGQNQKEVFKNIILKRVLLSEKEVISLNPQKTGDAQKPKIFMYNEKGIAQFWVNGKKLESKLNKHLSSDAIIEGAKKAGYLIQSSNNTKHNEIKTVKAEEVFSGEYVNETVTLGTEKTLKTYDELLDEGEIVKLEDGEWIKIPGTSRLFPCSKEELAGSTGTLEIDEFFGDYKLKIEGKYYPISKAWLKN